MLSKISKSSDPGSFQTAASVLSLGMSCAWAPKSRVRVPKPCSSPSWGLVFLCWGVDVGSLGRSSAILMILTYSSYIINAEQRLNAMFCWILALLARYVGEGNGNPLQCSCLGNPRDGGAWWAAVYGVAQSRTRLKRLSSSSSSS